MIRLFLWLIIAIALTVCGATVKLGKRTFFGHIMAIWKTEEVQDFKKGVEDKAGPALDELGKRAKPALEKAGRAAKKGIEEYRRDGDAEAPARDDGAAGSGSTSPPPRPPSAPAPAGSGSGVAPRW